ncbi:molybdenum cofactor biosynthesis protein, partial [Halolamina salina]
VPVFCLPGSENAAALGAELIVSTAGHLAGLASRDEEGGTHEHDGDGHEHADGEDEHGDEKHEHGEGGADGHDH